MDNFKFNGEVKIEVFDTASAAIASLQEEAKELPSEIGSSDDLKTLKGFKSRVSKYRTSVEKRRKEVKKPYLDAGKAIDAEAKRITSGLQGIETPIASVVKEYEDRERIQNEKRIAEYDATINRINQFTIDAWNRSPDEIEGMIEEVDKLADFNFYERSMEAATAIGNARTSLPNILLAVKAAESAAAVEQIQEVVVDATFEDEETPQAEAYAIPHSLEGKLFKWSEDYDIATDAYIELINILEGELS